MQIQHKQHGAAHIVLVIAFVVTLVGVLSFLGYSAWQKQSADAGDTTTVGRQKPSVTVSPGGFNSYNFTATVAKDKGKNALQIPRYTERTSYLVVEASYDEKAPAEGIKYLEKLGDFARKAAGRKVKVCIEIRLEKAVAKREVYAYQSYVAKPGKSDGGDKVFKVGTVYKNYCLTSIYVGKKEMNKILSATDPRIFNLGIKNNSKAKLYIRKATFKVVD